MAAPLSGNVDLLVRDVSCDVRCRQARGVPKRILHGAHLRILPSEFVAVIGANGSGKSTLMNIIASRMLPSEGTVLLNDRDLHANFYAVKQNLAFVPQQDVFHEQLTLRQALDCTAQLRLPPDTTVAQRHAAVNDAARSVDLLDRLICLSFELVSMAATGQGRRHDHETTVDNALTRGLVTAEPVIRRGASSV